MPPRSNVEVNVTQERIDQLRAHFEAHGIDMKGVRAVDFDVLDSALNQGWKAPKKAALEQEQSEATGHKKHSKLATYLIHHARAYVGEE